MNEICLNTYTYMCSYRHKYIHIDVRKYDKNKTTNTKCMDYTLKD
jgi:hypothetical protein